MQQSSLRTPQQCFWGPHHPQGGRHHHQGGQHPHQEGQHPHQGGQHHHQAFFKIVQSGASSLAKQGGAYFSAVYGSIEDLIVAPGLCNIQVA